MDRDQYQPKGAVIMGKFDIVLAAAGVALLAAAPAGAQTYPSKPVHVVVPFAAGGPVDLTLRHLAPVLSEKLGQPIVVESRPGAGGSVGANAVARATPDGYTLYYGPLSGVSTVLMKAGVVGGKDLAPISNAMVHTYVYLVRADLPIHSFADLLAYSKSRASQGGVNFGQAGVPSGLVTRLLADRSGMVFTAIPYNGQAQTMQAMTTGEIDIATAANIPQNLVDAGKLRPLFVTRKMAAFPTMPSAAEVGVPGYEVGFYYGMWAPAGTPEAIRNKVSAEIAAIVKTPDMRDKFRVAAAGDTIGSTPAEQLRQYQTEIDFLTEAAKAANLQPE